MAAVAMLLSILASTVTLGACVMAWRARRAAQRLALEMVRLRDRLARAELHYEGGAPRAQGESPREEGLDRRVSSLEERLSGRLQHSAEIARRPRRAQDPVGAEPRARILGTLAREGYEEVRFLDAREEGDSAGPGAGCCFEARRAGVTAKGRAEILPDGSVRLRAVTSLRAFP